MYGKRMTSAVPAADQSSFDRKRRPLTAHLSGGHYERYTSPKNN
jgi:hypothetical protein